MLKSNVTMPSFFRLSIVYVLLQILSISKLLVCDEFQFYTAAVLEHVRFSDLNIHTPSELLEKNLEIYKQATKTASQNKVDIIVFPEFGLFPHDKQNRKALLSFAEDIPDPSIAVRNPCNEKLQFGQHKILRTLSCLAQTHNIYVVANMVDIKVCRTSDNTCPANNMNRCQDVYKECRPDGLKHFNTNVVFNRNGTLVTRYYKQHLYFEPDIDYPETPKHAYFQTEFGLFATFICFDICFKEAIDAIKERYVKTVVYPTYWFDHLPLGTAIQTHQAWAIAHKVNLLSSNVHFPNTGTIGSAIYAGTKGALVYTFNPNGETKLLISQVPIDPENPTAAAKSFESKIFYLQNGKFVQFDKENISHIPSHCSTKILGKVTNYTRDYRCGDLVHEKNKGTIAKLEKLSDHLEVCSGNLCCSLEYNASSMDEDFYLVAYSSLTILNKTYGFCVQNCYLTRCDTYGNEPCTVYPLKSSTKFMKVALEGNFTTEYIYPSAIKDKMRLVSANEWWYKNGQIIYKSPSSEGEELLSVGLQGRCYNQDTSFPT